MNRFLENRHVKYGLPFLILVIGSPFVLKHFGQIRYDYRTARPRGSSDKAKYGLNNANSLTPEEVYEKEVVESGVETDYEMIRGPRDYEPETLDSFKKLRSERLKEKNPLKIRKAHPE